MTARKNINLKIPITFRDAQSLLSKAWRLGWFGTHRFMFDEKDKKVGRGLNAVWLAAGGKRIAWGSDIKGFPKAVMLYETETNGGNVFHGKEAAELFELGEVRMKMSPRGTKQPEEIEWKIRDLESKNEKRQSRKKK